MSFPNMSTLMCGYEIPSAVSDRLLCAIVWPLVCFSSMHSPPKSEDRSLSSLSPTQVLSVMYQYAGSPPPSGGLAFDDVADGSFAAEAVVWAAEAGVTRGTSATEFSPSRSTDRAHTAALLHRFARTLEPAPA